MKEKKRIPTSAEPIVWTRPFTVLKNIGPPLAPEVRPGVDARDASPIAPKKNHGRVDIIRQTAHRGGKTVTVVTGFTGIGLAEQETFAKEM
jgi:translation initiation factor 1